MRIENLLNTLRWLAVVVIPLLWAISLYVNHMTFKKLHQTNMGIMRRLGVVIAAMGLDPEELPRFCFDCGALLEGGATQHAPDCRIRQLIENVFQRE